MFPKIENSLLETGSVGLGCVGVPLAVEFGRHYGVAGFGVKEKRIESLKKGIDNTLETSSAELAAARIRKLRRI